MFARSLPRYGGLDILVNNVGISFKPANPEPIEEQVEMTLATNYFGTRRVTEALLPLLRRGARVVNVSSGHGRLAAVVRTSELRRRLTSEDLTLDGLDR